MIQLGWFDELSSWVMNVNRYLSPDRGLGTEDYGT